MCSTVPSSQSKSAQNKKVLRGRVKSFRRKVLTKGDRFRKVRSSDISHRAFASCARQNNPTLAGLVPNMSPHARVLATLCLCCSAGDVARVLALRIAESTSSFETGLDGWTTGGMDRPFVREPRTPGSSPQRGPRNAGSGEAYVYAETSQSNFNVDYDLLGSVPPGEEVYGITFQYYLFGTTRGSAVLETSADGNRCRDARHVHTHPSTRTPSPRGRVYTHTNTLTHTDTH